MSPDAQYVSFIVPIGYEFTSLKLINYNSADDRGFVALQAGDKWTAVPSIGTLPGALAYRHFGSSAGSLCSQSYTGATTPVGVCATDPVANSDLFTRSLNGPIPGPLPAGPYTLWLQQTSTTPVGFTFQATSTPTPVPAPLPLLGLGAGLGISRRLRQRIRGRGVPSGPRQRGVEGLEVGLLAFVVHDRFGVSPALQGADLAADQVGAVHMRQLR